MSGLEGISTSWIGLMVTVLVLIIVWVALIAGLGLIVRGERKTEDQVLSEMLRLVEANMSCRRCRHLDRQVLHWLSKSRDEPAESQVRLSAGGPAGRYNPEGE
jgi:hypothetical protein